MGVQPVRDARGQLNPPGWDRRSLMVTGCGSSDGNAEPCARSEAGNCGAGKGRPAAWRPTGRWRSFSSRRRFCARSSSGRESVRAHVLTVVTILTHATDCAHHRQAMKTRVCGSIRPISEASAHASPAQGAQRLFGRQNQVVFRLDGSLLWDKLFSSFKHNNWSPRGRGCCDGKTKQAFQW